jgi:hypothetical protein
LNPAWAPAIRNRESSGFQANWQAVERGLSAPERRLQFEKAFAEAGILKPYQHHYIGVGPDWVWILQLRSVSLLSVRTTLGKALKAISVVLLLVFGALFGSDALDTGRLPLIAIAVFLLIALLFWIGDRLYPR